jgi:DNA polymerase-3 subunit epsilon
MRPIYYDTETTGTKADKDRIIELAAYDPVLNKTFVTLINPGIPIPSEATAIHGITDEMVATAPTSQEALRQFIDFCEGDTVLIAHNNDSFDLLFLKAEFERNSIPMPSWKFLDSLKWARRYRKDLPRHSLQFLREVYQIPANNAHRALDDVIVLHQVFSMMIDDLSLPQVFELLSIQKKLQHMPFGKYQGKPLKDVPPDYVKWLSNNGVFEKPDNKALKEAFETLNLLITK